jgi:TPR repeat protein
MFSMLAAGAHADELADGIAAWDRQDYARAHQIFSKLAQSGNAEAQLLLGEMYGFGEGVPENMEQATHWIGRAQAQGHKDATASLDTMRQRSNRKTAIAYYVSGYDGADVKYEKFGCVQPAFPERSVLQPEIKAFGAGMKAWRECYERFSANLAASLPAGKAIPEDVAKVMSVMELQQARVAMDKVYAAVNADATRQASAVIAANDAWAENTRVYTVGMARKVEDDARQRQRELDENNQRARAAVDAYRAQVK